MTDGFHVATPNDIRGGKVTDVYFLRAQEILRTLGQDPAVVAEIRTSSLPRDWPWAIFAGLDEALELLEPRGVEVQAIAEGSVFYAEEPVLTLAGSYLEFAELETALLGVLCQASGVATMAARCKRAAAGRPVYSFGARRMHPAVAPMIERAAFIGGCDGVATVAAAEVLGISPVGTMPHSLPLLLGEDEAWRSFDALMENRVPRVMLVDTFQDEKFGAVAAARLLKDRLAAVRLDTPASRRGDFLAILREVRWELDARGFSGVKIFASGGMDERAILELNPYADAYGVGTPISNAPVIDFALDIVEVNGERRAKRGKLSGRKHLWSCPQCFNRGIAPAEVKLGHCPNCGHRVRSLLEGWIARGKRKRGPAARDLRDRAIEEVGRSVDPFASA